MCFSSKRDWWMVALGVIGIIVCINGTLDSSSPTLLRILLAMVVILIIWIGIGTNYTITEEQLMVRSGPLTWKIPFSQITKIQPNDAISDYFFIKGPALSADRLDIGYKKEATYYSLLVSPDKKDEFVNLLKARCPNLMK